MPKPTRLESGTDQLRPIHEFHVTSVWELPFGKGGDGSIGSLATISNTTNLGREETDEHSSRLRRLAKVRGQVIDDRLELLVRSRGTFLNHGSYFVCPAGAVHAQVAEHAKTVAFSANTKHDSFSISVR